MDDLLAAIRMEAARLDAVRQGWAAEIDRKRLNLGKCLDCIHGQLFGNCHDVMDSIESLEPELARRVARASNPHLPDPEATERAMRRLWLAEIDARTGGVGR